MPERSPPPPESMRAEARHVYGTDPETYAAGRPGYPDRVYDLLRQRCGIGEGTAVVEIGPGAGEVTRRLVDMGAAVTAVEPDQGFARYLAATMDELPVEVVAATFEDAALPPDAFDAAVAAMSFHWIDQRAGLAKLRRTIRPGGWVAMWWTVFGDPDRADPFGDAIRHLLGDGHRAEPGGNDRHFELDSTARLADLRHAGFTDVESELIPWTIRLAPAAARRLYASTIAVLRRPPDERERVLDGIVAVAEERFGGAVERPFVTAVYTARRPSAGGQ